MEEGIGHDFDPLIIVRRRPPRTSYDQPPCAGCSQKSVKSHGTSAKRCLDLYHSLFMVFQPYSKYTTEKKWTQLGLNSEGTSCLNSRYELAKVRVGKGTSWRRYELTKVRVGKGTS